MNFLSNDFSMSLILGPNKNMSSINDKFYSKTTCELPIDFRSMFISYSEFSLFKIYKLVFIPTF